MKAPKFKPGDEVKVGDRGIGGNDAFIVLNDQLDITIKEAIRDCRDRCFIISSIIYVDKLNSYYYKVSDTDRIQCIKEDALSLYKSAVQDDKNLGDEDLDEAVLNFILHK